jgi:molybdopterin converting factor small subunit
MGSYAVRLLFDDGHDTGVYSWNTLKELGDNFESNWKDYQLQLDKFKKLNQGDSKITVLFFIGLVDALGLEKLELDLSDDTQRVEDVIQLLAGKGENWKEALNPERLTITVNKQFSNVDQKLFNGDEVAFVPKM